MAIPFISICVPVYNGERYLRECLDSCFDQNYSNFEVVLCDDGSGDGSLAIISEYQKQYPQLRVYQNEKNLGLVGNWNRCMELAKGEWIKFVFQDDFIIKECLSEFVKRIKSDTQLLVSKRHFVLPADAGAEVRNYYSSVVRTLENTCGAKAHFSAKELSRAAIKNIGMNFIAEPSLTMFRKEVPAELGTFNPMLKQICDLEFMLRLGSRYGLDYVPQTLCVFRIHAASTTNLNVSSKHFELSFIEPVLYSGLLLYTKEFSTFRTHLDWFSYRKLKLYFQIKAYRAKRKSDNLGVDHSVFKEHFVFSQALHKAARGSILIKILDRLI